MVILEQSWTKINNVNVKNHESIMYAKNYILNLIICAFMWDEYFI